MAAYYIVNDSIYQAPDLYSILATRLVSYAQRTPFSLLFALSSRPDLVLVHSLDSLPACAVQQSTVYGLKSSLSTQRCARPSFDPRRGHHGRFIVPDPPTATPTAKHGNKLLKHAHSHDNNEEQEEGEQEEEEEEEEIDLESVNDGVPPAAIATGAPQVKRARFD